MLRAKGRVNARRRAEGAQGMSAEGKESKHWRTEEQVFQRGKFTKITKEGELVTAG